MSIELKTVMGQMNIVRGRWVSEAANAVAVREPSSRPRDSFPKGDLFVVVEVRGDPARPTVGNDRRLAECTPAELESQRRGQRP